MLQETHYPSTNYDFIFISHQSDIEDIVWSLTDMNYSVCVLEKEDILPAESPINTLYYDDINRHSASIPLLGIFSEKQILNQFLYQKEEHCFHYPFKTNLFKRINFFFRNWINLQKSPRTAKYKLRFKKDKKNWELKRPVFQQNRIKIELLKSAQKKGLDLFIFSEIEAMEIGEKQNIKILIKDKKKRQKQLVEGKQIIHLYPHNLNPKDSEISLSKGIRKRQYLLQFHFPAHRLNIKQSCFFHLKTGQQIYIIYKNESCTLAWHSDKTTFGSEIEFILSSINHLFSGNLSLSDIQFNKPIVSDSICIFRPKNLALNNPLPTFRNNKQLLDFLLKKNSKNSKRQPSPLLVLSANFNKTAVKEHDLAEFSERKYHESYQINATFQQIQVLFQLYGSQIDQIIEWAYELYNTSKNRQLILLEAEIMYLVQHEFLQDTKGYWSRSTFYQYLDLGGDTETQISSIIETQQQALLKAHAPIA